MIRRTRCESLPVLASRARPGRVNLEPSVPCLSVDVKWAGQLPGIVSWHRATDGCRAALEPPEQQEDAEHDDLADNGHHHMYDAPSSASIRGATAIPPTTQAVFRKSRSSITELQRIG